MHCLSIFWTKCSLSVSRRNEVAREQAVARRSGEEGGEANCYCDRADAFRRTCTWRFVPRFTLMSKSNSFQRVSFSDLTSNNILSHVTDQARRWSERNLILCSKAFGERDGAHT